MTGAIIGMMGIGGAVTSRGIIDLVEKAAGHFGWAGKTFSHFQGADALAWLKANANGGPVVIIGNSMGVHAGDLLAEKYGKPVAAFFSVVSAYAETLPSNVQRIYQITADKDWRQFKIRGSVVTEKKVISSSHVSADDSAELEKFVLAEIKKLAGPAEPKATEMIYDSVLDDLDLAWSTFMDPAKEDEAQRRWNEAFFAGVRGRILKPLTLDQVNGLKTMVFIWRRFFSAYPQTYFAAVAGQCVRETGGQFQPVRETFAKNTDQVVKRLEKAWAAGKLQAVGVKSPYWRHDGVGYPFGRGLIQVTHRENMTAAENMLLEKFNLHVDLDTDYDLALDPLVSALIAFGGCIHGIFTGEKLADFERADGTLDYYQARGVVNGDKKLVGEEIRADCIAFEDALRAAEGVAPGWLAMSAHTDVETAPGGPILLDPGVISDLPSMTLAAIRELPPVKRNKLAVAAADYLKLFALIVQEGEDPVASLPPVKTVEYSANEKGNPEMLTGSKSIFKSKTIIGIVIALAGSFIPGLKPILDIVTPDTVTTAPAVAVELESLIRQAIELFGLAMAAWGRITATEQVTVVK